MQKTIYISLSIFFGIFFGVIGFILIGYWVGWIEDRYEAADVFEVKLVLNDIEEDEASYDVLVTDFKNSSVQVRNRYGSELYVEGRLSEAEEEKTYWAIIYQYDWYVFGKRIKEDASGVEEVYGTKEEALDQLEKWKKRNMKTSK